MRLIFHIPLKIDRTDPSASQIRPQKLLAAFASLGWEVDVVEGRARERRQQIRAVKKRILAGTRYDFLYSESSTMPTLLTEPHHLPTHPCLDFGFLAFCRRKGIPVGLFYRDIHWQYANRGAGFKQWVARFFYRYDLRRYGELLDVLFLPTLPMREHIPYRFCCKVCELPAGYSGPAASLEVGAERRDGAVLKVVYVGGVGGNYNMLPLIEAVRGLDGVSLTLCCRTYDWDAVKSEYEPHLSENVKVLHVSGAALEEIYRDSDLFAMTMSTEYVRFAAPYKLFEAIGHHLPVLAATNTWSGDVVMRNGIGLTSENEADALRQTLLSLRDQPERLQDFRSHLPAMSERNTWQARCRQIAEALVNNKNK